MSDLLNRVGENVSVISEPIEDGVDELMSPLDLSETMGLIEKTARWVLPETFHMVPVWYPAHARGRYCFKNNWSEEKFNINRKDGSKVHKQEGNLYANKDLTHALGLRSKERKNWSCCHIWGVDDPTFQRANDVVQDPRFYSYVANMVLLPTPLKVFTDTVPAVKVMFRLCAADLYNWRCEHDEVSDKVAAMEEWTD